jgi:cation transport ATPase
MKPILLALTTIALSALPVLGAPDRVMTVKAGVDGMVCSFCAQGLLTHFRNHAAVSNIHISLNHKMVILEERKGSTITDKEILDAIKRAGLTATGTIERVKTPFEEVKRSKRP